MKLLGIVAITGSIIATSASMFASNDGFYREAKGSEKYVLG